MFKIAVSNFTNALMSDDILRENRERRYCWCGAPKEQYWNVDSLEFEWYCQECDAKLEIDEKW